MAGLFRRPLFARSDRIGRQSLAVFCGWTLIVGASFWWNERQTGQQVLALAAAEAKANLSRDLAFRRWATDHGGIYVRVDANTPPSPYLAGVPNQNVVAVDGGVLTLYNPARALREIMERYTELYGVKARITAFQVFNPIDQPDAWEAKALRAVEHTRQDYAEVAEIGGKPYLRMLQPMYMEEGCLKCHAWTGIKVGGIRGGTAVAVPLEPYLQIRAASLRDVGLTHGGLWLIGVGVIGFVARRARRHADEAEAAARTVEHLAFYDSLTDLPNRRLLRDHLERTVAWSRRTGAVVALLYLDLDRFKYVNDTLGHPVGDGLLLEVGTRLAGCVRDNDLVARLGGDEFAIVVGDVQRIEDAGAVAEKILAALDKPFSIEGHEVYVSTSIGISLFPTDTQRIDELIRNADIAMYQAKDRGKATFQYYDEAINALTVERLDLEHGLRRAIEHDELLLEYQPKLDLRSGAIFAVEALVRWNHPKLGRVAPARFIPLAEESRLIVPLGEWVLRRACNEVGAWDFPGAPEIGVSVNLSPMQFRRKGLVDCVRRVLEETGLPPRRLELEITESALMDNPDEAVKNLLALRELGVSVSIDDFGTGYSSLNHLKRFPVSVLKIDRSFVSHINSDPDDKAIAEAVIALARSLRLASIAEGVETADQLATLKALGCDAVQGYYAGRPLPADELPGLIRQRCEAARCAA